MPTYTNAVESLDEEIKYGKRRTKFIKKFMHLAKSVANDNDACYSRQIGVVISDPNFRVVSLGYNGPPAGTPHCDTVEYLKNFYVPQLTVAECVALGFIGTSSKTNIPNPNNIERWCRQKNGCKTCPRRFVNAGPGERSTLCSCQHAERNAITNATRDLDNCIMYCWCGVPCIDCAGAIINSGIRTVHCLAVDGPDYHPVSRWLFQEAEVSLNIWKEAELA